jgi:hypothetical protein
MINAENAIARLRRDLTLTSLLKAALLAGALLSMAAQTLVRPHVIGPSIALGIILAIWLVLSYRSARGSRIAAESSSLIAAGQFDQAERRIDQALRAFSLFRTVKLRSLHHLALLRHAQRRFADAALLCRALLAQRLGVLAGLSRSARLILADALLEVGDLHGAHDALSDLYRHRLTLAEALELTALQLDYLARIGAWDHVIAGVSRKTDLAELMPPPKSARAQAALALAARKTRRPDWEQFLLRRVELLADIPDLLAQNPMFAELWPHHQRV